jgi:hypothetical protein
MPAKLRQSFASVFAKSHYIDIPINLVAMCPSGNSSKGKGRKHRGRT